MEEIIEKPELLLSPRDTLTSARERPVTQQSELESNLIENSSESRQSERQSEQQNEGRESLYSKIEKEEQESLNEGNTSRPASQSVLPNERPNQIDIQIQNRSSAMLSRRSNQIQSEMDEFQSCTSEAIGGESQSFAITKSVKGSHLSERSEATHSKMSQRLGGASRRQQSNKISGGGGASALDFQSARDDQEDIQSFNDVENEDLEFQDTHQDNSQPFQEVVGDKSQVVQQRPQLAEQVVQQEPEPQLIESASMSTAQILDNDNSLATIQPMEEMMIERPGLLLSPSLAIARERPMTYQIESNLLLMQNPDQNEPDNEKQSERNSIYSKVDAAEDEFLKGQSEEQSIIQNKELKYKEDNEGQTIRDDNEQVIEHQEAFKILELHNDQLMMAEAITNARYSLNEVQHEVGNLQTEETIYVEQPKAGEETIIVDQPKPDEVSIFQDFDNEQKSYEQADKILYTSRNSEYQNQIVKIEDQFDDQTSQIISQNSQNEQLIDIQQDNHQDVVIVGQINENIEKLGNIEFANDYLVTDESQIENSLLKEEQKEHQVYTASEQLDFDTVRVPAQTLQTTKRVLLIDQKLNQKIIEAFPSQVQDVESKIMHEHVNTDTPIIAQIEDQRKASIKSIESKQSEQRGEILLSSVIERAPAQFDIVSMKNEARESGKTAYEDNLGLLSKFLNSNFYQMCQIYIINKIDYFYQQSISLRRGHLCVDDNFDFKQEPLAIAGKEPAHFDVVSMKNEARESTQTVYEDNWELISKIMWTNEIISYFQMFHIIQIILYQRLKMTQI